MKKIVMLAVCSLAIIGLASASTFEKKTTATLRALDKITGRSTDIKVKVGTPVVFGSLKVELKVCYQTPPEETPESAAFLKIESTQPVALRTIKESRSEKKAREAAEAGAEPEKTPELFSGWMYASSPGLSALEHPVYDIWVVRCATPPVIKLPDAAVVSEADEPLYEDAPAVVEEVTDPAAIEAAPTRPR
jgi:hypothetical protein